MRKSLSLSVKCLRQGSNLHLQFRKPSFYPLNYGDLLALQSGVLRRPESPVSEDYWNLAGGSTLG